MYRRAGVPVGSDGRKNGLLLEMEAGARSQPPAMTVGAARKTDQQQHQRGMKIYRQKAIWPGLRL
jgi:hypothetical protein